MWLIRPYKDSVQGFGPKAATGSQAADLTKERETSEERNIGLEAKPWIQPKS